ncbi:carotenoid ester lipase precursor [Trametes punicea]|nr:carotenoid ester lipase precursor [Trametes punicea]
MPTSTRLATGWLLALAVATVVVSSPTVILDKATVIGKSEGAVTSYFGIPFAEPPIGDLRLRLPKPITRYSGTINATVPATQCPQLPPGLRSDLPSEIVQDMLAYFSADVLTTDTPQSEDCLSISVQVPAGTKPGDKLPVLALVFGGGFTTGSTALYPGNALVERSIELQQPVVFVNMNYRLSVFGFLGGKEIKEAGVGNLGLQDQRVALRWIKNHISAFGGDPDKVTLWGDSAGAISIALQMVTNGGDNEGLFRGAVMMSGSPIPTGDIELLQPSYDTVVEQSGCAGEDDTLECLRTVSTDTLMKAAAAVPNLFDYPGLDEAWAPRADGKFLEAPAQHLVLAGSVADVPFISGDCLDEGTIFATGSFNVTTEQEFRDFVHDTFFSSTPETALAPLFSLYPNDPAAGSPFGTGDANQLAPQFKRMAAFQGDIVFQAPRRFFLDQRSSKQPTWSFMSERNGTTGLGFPHGGDFVAALRGDDFADYVLRFTATLDPNGGLSNRTIRWPKYDSVARQILRLVDDGQQPLMIGTDTARLQPMATLTALTIAHPF